MKASDLKRYFRYLDELRASGDINMFAAPGRLVALYGLTNVEAMEATYAWMKTYADDQTLDQRVARAVASQPPVKAESG